MPDVGNMAVVSERIMVAAIIVLLLVVIFVMFLHLYAKWFWWQMEEDATTDAVRRRRFVFTPGQETAAAAQVTLKRGLDASVLRSLDVVVFDPVGGKDGLECAVCLCEVVEGEKARMLPKCNHVFHIECIDMWFESHSTCPLCRNLVVEESKSGVQMVALEEDGVENVLDGVSNGVTNESRSFPTNVLFWGNEVQVSSGASVVDQGSNASLNDEMVVVDMPRRVLENSSSSASLPSGMRFSEEDQKLPLTTRLRTLKRMLSRDRRVILSSSSSLDVEQGTSRG